MKLVAALSILAFFLGGANVSGTIGGFKVKAVESAPGGGACEIPADIPCDISG